MLWASASCLLILLIAAPALYFISRQLQAALVLQRELETTLHQLKPLLPAAYEATARLAAAIQRAESLQTIPPRDTLAAIESLAEPGALADANSLDKLAVHLSSQPSDVAANIFEQDEKALSVARLCDQGLKPAEISRRLSLPIGEIEFLLSLRPASQA